MVRGWMDHPFFRQELYTEREAWLWLIENASPFDDAKDRSGRFYRPVNRGQLCASIRDMAEIWKWNKSKVERYIKRLTNETMIETESETGILIITI